MVSAPSYVIIFQTLLIEIAVQLARASQSANGNVQSVALCAGSGGSVIGNVPADLYFTGEMSHVRIHSVSHFVY